MALPSNQEAKARDNREKGQKVQRHQQPFEVGEKRLITGQS